MDMNHFNEMLVNNIRKICKNKKILISQMEIDLGFSPGLISRWSRTKTSPSFDKVVSVMQYLDITYEELTGEGKITSVNFSSDSKERRSGSKNSTYEIILEKTMNGQMQWKRTGDQLPIGISPLDDIFTDWHLYDIHKYYFTVIGQSLFMLIIEYNSKTCQLYEALYVIYYQLDGSCESILEQDRRLLDLLRYIDEEDYDELCSHYKEHFLHSFDNHDYINEPKFKKVDAKR